MTKIFLPWLKKFLKAGGDVDSPDALDTAIVDTLTETMRRGGMEVIDDVDEGQRVLDEENGEVKLMGSRTEKKKAMIAQELDGRELTQEQQVVVDVFTGRNDNQPLVVHREDGDHRVVMRQGNDRGAGTKHSLFGHFGTTEGVFTADDILKIPDVLAKGERAPKKRRGKQLYKYTLKDESGTEYTVLTEVNNRGVETFADFYSDKKASSTARKTRSEEAQADIDNASSSA